MAEREFAEELGRPAPDGLRVDLGEIIQAGGKRVRAWAVEGDFEAADATSNHFEIEWPPRSGRRKSFPEVDRAGWFRSPKPPRSSSPPERSSSSGSLRRGRRDPRRRPIGLVGDPEGGAGPGGASLEDVARRCLCSRT